MAELVHSRRILNYHGVGIFIHHILWPCGTHVSGKFNFVPYPVLFCIVSINPPATARDKISQNVDILPKVYLVHVHLKVKHCQTLRVVSTFTGQNELTVFEW